MAEKRYYWLKLQEDFFKSKRIKKLRRLAGGDTYTIIYLKMQLLAMKTDGILEYSGLEESFAEELALDLDESSENVDVTVRYLLSCGLLETSNNREFFVPYAISNTGSEGSSAKRMRELRERKASQSDNGVTRPLQIGYGEKEIEIEKEIDTSEETDVSSSCGEPRGVSPPMAALPLNDKTEYLVTEEQVNMWAELYPAVDVMQQLRNMKGWLDANPQKRKTRSGIKRFINGWLGREQNRGGGKSQMPQSEGRKSFRELAAEMDEEDAR